MNKGAEKHLVKNESKTYSVRVRVTLREKQYRGANKWNCTVLGEERVVLLKEVEWYCAGAEEAAKSFKETEILSFTISGAYPD